MTAHAQGSEIQKASPSGAAALASLVWLDWRRAVMPQERLCRARLRAGGWPHRLLQPTYYPSGRCLLALGSRLRIAVVLSAWRRHPRTAMELAALPSVSSLLDTAALRCRPTMVHREPLHAHDPH